MGGSAVLDDRALNRATLARQHLLQRAALDPTALAGELVGLQAQTPHTWYVGIWSRLADFDPESVSTLLQQRILVRVSMMRSTIHLVTADDCLALRRLFDPVNARGLRSSFARALDGVDLDQLAAAGREILSAGPRTFAQLGRDLGQRWPAVDPGALAQGVRALEVLVQVPPRGLWGRSGHVAHTTAQAWLGRPVAAQPSPVDLVRRYLAAFGPATAMDAQAWSGLTRLGEVFDGMREELVTFRDGAGRELFDLPDAPRPSGQTEVPPRFLADFDNLLLGYADRSRVVTAAYLRLWQAGNGVLPRAFLLGGVTAGTWRVDDTTQSWTLHVEPFTRPGRADRVALETEASALLRFLASAARRPPASLSVRLAH